MTYYCWNEGRVLWRRRWSRCPVRRRGRWRSSRWATPQTRPTLTGSSSATWASPPAIDPVSRVWPSPPGNSLHLIDLFTSFWNWSYRYKNENPIKIQSGNTKHKSLIWGLILFKSLALNTQLFLQLIDDVQIFILSSYKYYRLWCICWTKYLFTN